MIKYNQNPQPFPEPRWYRPGTQSGSKPAGWYYERVSGWSYGPFRWEEQALTFEDKYLENFGTPDSLTVEKVEELLNEGAKLADKMTGRILKWQFRC